MHRILPILLLGLVAAFNASATVVYSYSGNPYDSYDSTETLAPLPFDSTMSVSGFFSVESALASNLDDIDTGTGLIPLDFSFSNGVATLDRSNTAGAFISLGTDDSGAITEWNIFFNSSSRGVGIGGTVDRILTNFSADPSVDDFDLGEVIYCTRVSTDSLGDYCAGGNYHRAFASEPGSWSMSAVPIPGAIWLFAPALALITLVRRKPV